MKYHVLAKYPGLDGGEWKLVCQNRDYWFTGRPDAGHEVGVFDKRLADIVGEDWKTYDWEIRFEEVR
jgi:hypothetical protein